MTSAFRFGAALTPLDRQNVWFGRHPCTNVNVGLLTIFDGQVEPDLIFNALDRNVQRVPRLREGLAWPLGGLRIGVRPQGVIRPARTTLRRRSRSNSANPSATGRWWTHPSCHPAR